MCVNRVGEAKVVQRAVGVVIVRGGDVCVKRVGESGRCWPVYVLQTDGTLLIGMDIYS